MRSYILHLWLRRLTGSCDGYLKWEALPKKIENVERLRLPKEVKTFSYDDTE